jgi:type IV pilus assembly protein PilC
MAKFSYKARDTQDRLHSGTMDGESIDDCVERLEARGMVPISVEERSADGNGPDGSFSERVGERFHAMRTRVPYRNVVFFTRQLATMINGGVPLPKAVDQLSRDEIPVFKRMLEQVCYDLGMGSNFSDAVSKHPGAFGNMFVAVIRAGETAGALDTVLNQLADYMENTETMKSKVKAAMRYPMVISVFVLVIVTGVLIKLVPIFKDMYANFGAKLPGPTLLLISVSDAIRNNALITLLAIAAVIAAVFVLQNMESASCMIHKYILKAPVFGNILRKNILAIYCRTMSLLMNSGTPILEATQITEAAVNNKHYAKALQGVYNDLRHGEPLSKALTRAEEFPVLVTQMVSTGEESGRIDELLNKAAEFYDKEIRNIVDSMASIIEPVLIVILGGIVGSILIALYLPVFYIGKLIR